MTGMKMPGARGVGARAAAAALALAALLAACGKPAADNPGAIGSDTPIGSGSATAGPSAGTSGVPSASTSSGTGGSRKTGTPTAKPTFGKDPKSGRVLTATDRGVTKDSIKLAWFEVEKAERQLGASIGMSWAATLQEPMVYVQPFVDEINSRGGINGRKLNVELIEYQTVSFDDMQAACVRAAEDMKVFGAITGVGFWGDGEVCLGTKQIPTLTYNSASADQLYRREKGWVRETLMNKDRVVKNLIDWLVASKTATPSMRVGVPYLETPEYKQVVEKVVLPYLKQKGLNVVQKATFSTSYDETPRQAASAVLLFKQSDVNFVFPALTWWEMYHFTNQAQAQSYKPKYTTSDFGELAKDPPASIFAPEQWDGTTGIAVTRTGELAAGKPRTAQQKECESVFTSRGGSIQNASDRDYVWIVCEHLRLFEIAASAAGPNLTRQRYLDALDALGSYTDRTALSDTLKFGKGKWDAADRYAVVKWHASCKCYHQIEGFRTGRW
ncbi:MAG: ABC transporter substrate-binding protein [Actinomycetota bacterium]